MKIIKSFLLIGLFTLIAATAVSAQQSGEINGEVADAFGGAVVGATISISNGAGFEKTAETDGSGRFVVGGLIPGR